LIVIKLADFTDNATGLIYTTGPKVKKLATKYLQVVPILLKAIERPDMPLSPKAKAHIRQQLILTYDRLAMLAA
jgi:hypothetical protein